MEIAPKVACVRVVAVAEDDLALEVLLVVRALPFDVGNLRVELGVLFFVRFLQGVVCHGKFVSKLKLCTVPLAAKGRCSVASLVRSFCAHVSSEQMRHGEKRYQAPVL
jgi:hypothetical protein